MSSVAYYLEINLICIAVLAIMFFSLPSAHYQNLRGKIFKAVLISTIVMCFGDLFAGIFAKNTFPGANIILWTANIVFLVAGVLISCLWMHYSIGILFGKMPIWLACILNILTVGISIFIITAPLNGWAFTLDACNAYHRGPLIWIQWVFAIPCEILPSILALFSKAEKRERAAIASFAIAPLAATIVQTLFYGISVIQAGVTIAIVLPYAILQTREVIAAQVRASLYNEISSLDSLTKIKNRRAYDQTLSDAGGKQWTGVVFFDMNGLKFTNDNFGHKAGDELLINFSNILRKYFSKDEVFRISGDEFVVLSFCESKFRACIGALHTEVGDKAAMGIAEGNGADAMALVNEAEQKMYADKNDYYKRSGKERRKS